MLWKVLRAVLRREPFRPRCLFHHRRGLVHWLRRWNQRQEGWPDGAAFVSPGAGERWIHPHAWQPLSSEYGIFGAWEGDSPLPETSRTQSGLWGTRWIKRAQNRALGNVIQVNAWPEVLGDCKWQCLNYGESWEEGVGLTSFVWMKKRGLLIIRDDAANRISICVAFLIFNV